ncbi:MAG TPA: hypothetical protein VMI94_09220 [Bryobacteraceae bacterium]|nr:hypothetical protein [Bryobacteraceae bacterium]
MKDTLLKLFAKLQIFKQDHGQDLIEYALVAAVVALAAVAGMGNLAGAINNAFSVVGSTLTKYAT